MSMELIALIGIGVTVITIGVETRSLGSDLYDSG